MIDTCATGQSRLDSNHPRKDLPMTGPGQHDDKTSTRTGRSDPPPSRTDAGARTTARMAGTEPLSSDADHRLVNNKSSAAAVF